MRWRGGEQSDNVEDRRRIGTGGLAIGVGGLLLLLAVGVLFGVDPQQLGKILQDVQQQQVRNPNANGDEERELTPEEKEQGEFVGRVMLFTEVVWDEQFRRGGQRYEAPKMVLFYDRVQTGCGVAPSAVGPFYCPLDQKVYLDPSFFTELTERLGGSKAEFSQAYVIAHEVGHHVQNLLGYSELVQRKRRTDGSNEWSVRLELQADYLAGVWAHYGQEKFNFIEPGDIEAAITTANAIGDDRIQRRSTGFTSPENYTHGTSEQRVRWFKRGLETGDLERLDELFKIPYDRL